MEPQVIVTSRRVSRAVLALLALAFLALPSVPAAQTPRPERPAYTVGDTWPLADATCTLARLERGAFVGGGSTRS